MPDDTVAQFLNTLEDGVRAELTTPVEIVEEDSFVDLSDLELYAERRTWKRVEDVVVVVSDLKGSTKLDFGGHANTSARLYESVMGNCARIVDRFSPSFVDLQGDGMFAMYHGERRYERALCAGITLKTFSENVLVPRVQQHLPDRFPDTGLKVGLHAGTIVAKQVGIRGSREPIWAGKPVNWAFKAAQKADAHQLVATRKVFQKFESNDYVTHSCGCQSGEYVGSFSYLWSDFAVDTLPDTTAECMVLRSGWCDDHGDDFCQAILDGKRKRDEISGAAA